MEFPKECVIIGGGASILPQIKVLQPILASKFVIACNYSYKHFSSTFTVFNDREFYHPKPEDNNPDIYEELKALPMIVGINHNGIEEFKLKNTILLDKKEREVLTGILALKLAIKLMESGNIYLLGFDWNRRTGLPERDPNYNPNSDYPTHYYTTKEINHRGVGYMGYYENHNPDREFAKLIKKDVKVFNVSLESNINCFPKIDYPTMFKLLSDVRHNQEELRLEIKNNLI